MLKSKLISIFAAILFFSQVGSARATTYYVMPSGNDTNNGLSSTTPFKTFSKAVSVLAPGDTLNTSGIYNTGLNLSKSGTASAPIKIVGNGTKINLSGLSQGNGIIISGSYLNVSGFDVSGTASHAVLISGTNIIFENSQVHNSVTENNSTSTNPAVGSECNGNVGWGSGIKAMVGSQNLTIRGNSVYENCGEGIGITRSVRTSVENNTVRDNFSVNIYIDNSPYSSANNNNVKCTGRYLRSGKRMAGIVVAEEYYSGWNAQRHDNSVTNNLIDGCNEGVSAWLSESQVSNGKFINGVISGNTIINGMTDSIRVRSINQNVVISNNTIYKAVNVGSASTPGLTLTNNVISNTPTTPVASVAPTPIATPASKPGDSNNDNAVNELDYKAWFDHILQGVSGLINGDFSGDSMVDGIDYVIWMNNYGK